MNADNAGPWQSPRTPGGVSRDAGGGDTPAASWRSFAVEAWAGRKATGWPLGRFDIGSAGLRVRLSFPWFTTRSAGKDTITSVSIARHAVVWCVRFEDANQCLADVHVHLPMRAQRIIDELRQHGYAVMDRRTGGQVVRLPKRWHGEADHH